MIEVDPPTRPTLDETLMTIALIWARRSTCARVSVGTVLAVDGRTIASGYNGAPRDMPNCSHACNCDLEGTYFGTTFVTNGHRTDCASQMPCTLAVHAEANAVAFAARNGISTVASTLYTTLMPCLTCAALLVNAGVMRVVAIDEYRDPAGHHLLRDAGVEIEFVDFPRGWPT